MKNYRVGDRICIFGASLVPDLLLDLCPDLTRNFVIQGFSRGAFTARYGITPLLTAGHKRD